MTEISINRNGDRYGVGICGHCEYAGDGEPDIVCAAVSTLGFTLLKTIEKLSGDGGLIRICNIDCESGKMNIDFALADAGVDGVYRNTVDSVLSTATVGFGLIAENYPENVRLNSNISPFETAERRII